MSETNYEINLTNVRISYPHLFEPFAWQGQGTPKYSARFLLHKTEHADLIKQIASKIKQLSAESYKDKKMPPPDKLCLRDGDLSGRDEEVGYWTLNASESSRPVVVDRQRRPLTAEDEVIFPGCRVNAKINLWAQDNKYGRRANANLLGVQFVKDDERLGTGRTRQSADEMFEASDFADSPGGSDDDPFGSDL